MKKYVIIGETDGWRASRSVFFNGCTKRIAKAFDTLKEANAELLRDFCEDHANHTGIIRNWGNAVATGYANKTYDNGTRSYEYDGYYWSTEEIDELPGFSNWEYEKMSWWSYEKAIDEANEL